MIIKDVGIPLPINLEKEGRHRALLNAPKICERNHEVTRKDDNKRGFPCSPTIPKDFGSGFDTFHSCFEGV